jgi:hypothetical protein
MIIPSKAWDIEEALQEADGDRLLSCPSVGGIIDQLWADCEVSCERDPGQLPAFPRPNRV